MQATTIGLIWQRTFQVHGEDAHGKVVVRKRLTEGQCCAGSPTHRRLGLASRPAVVRTTGRASLMGLGHDVRILPPQYVKPL
ncbi:MAG: hypothetical protein M5R42_02040 [Rhodocyclaceae bacterium]|nr:hypothetical protein [Rhodocyclaceae bacterium]